MRRVHICTADHHDRYHAHYHGSSTLQLMGGLFGMMIVDSDSTLALPDSLANLPEEIFVISMMKYKTEDSQDCDKTDTSMEHDFFKLFSFDELEEVMQSEVRAAQTLTHGREDFALVNGQYQPTLKLVPGEKKSSARYTQLAPDIPTSSSTVTTAKQTRAPWC